MPAVIRPYLGVAPKIAADAFIAETAVVVGDVVIGAGSSLWYGTVVRGDVNEVRIGADTNIQDGTVVHVSGTLQGTYIGDGITIGHMALLHACTLEDACFIGMKACVMDGVVVETGAMVAAGAVVPPGRRVRTGELWAGVPAKCLRELRQEERDYIVSSPAHYRDLAMRYLGTR